MAIAHYEHASVREVIAFQPFPVDRFGTDGARGVHLDGGVERLSSVHHEIRAVEMPVPLELVGSLAGGG